MTLLSLWLLGVLQSATAPAPAFIVWDLPSRRVLASSHEDILRAPVLPGSIAKMVTLAAALDEGVVTGATRLACTKRVRVGRHDLVCVHPDLARPLTPADALAHSCNPFFATIAPRIPRAALNRMLVRLGLPPADERASPAAVGLGLDGVRASPLSLLEALVRIAGDSTLGLREEHLRLLRDGLRAAAASGTASALSARGVDALAKTGTVVANGKAQGLVVAAAPPVNPTRAVVVLAPGAAGAEAAAIAADLLASRDRPRDAAAEPILKIGHVGPDGTTTVGAMPLEEYVAAVVAGEQQPGSVAAALEALAITARTYALANLGRHRSEGFDLCDLTHCQVAARETPGSRAAAEATRGRILVFNGRPAPVFYTAACGGRSERSDAVWPGTTYGFLRSMPDPGCDRLPGWSSELRAVDLERTLLANGFTGRLRGLRIAGRTESGRVAMIELIGLAPGEITGERLRTIVGRGLGWQYLKSAAFSVTRTASGYRFTGRGAGHGVGLCIVGSARHAARGETAEQILQRYFPGLTLPGRHAQPEPRSPSSAGTATRLQVELPASAAGERPAIERAARGAVRDLSGTLGVDPPSRVTLVFHPTVEAFRRSTRVPWWFAASTRGNRVEFIPIEVLRARGLLERVLRHEIVHVLTDAALRGRAAWIREGVAVVFAGELDSSNSRAAHCPPEVGLQALSTPDAVRAAYVHAGACFAKVLATGARWTDVR